jgi:hypothetical protein
MQDRIDRLQSKQPRLQRLSRGKPAARREAPLTAVAAQAFGASKRSMRSCIFLRLSLQGTTTPYVSANGGDPRGRPVLGGAMTLHAVREQGDHKGRPYTSAFITGVAFLDAPTPSDRPKRARRFRADVFRNEDGGRP